jgi:hypothetical protein
MQKAKLKWRYVKANETLRLRSAAGVRILNRGTTLLRVLGETLDYYVGNTNTDKVCETSFMVPGAAIEDGLSLEFKDVEGSTTNNNLAIVQWAEYTEL